LFNRRDYVNLNTNDPIASLPFRRQGLAGRFTYDFDNRYLAEFNFGYNGSEQFAPQHRYGFFPSLSLGWIPSGEAFWKENSILSYLKIRGSYGKVGNDNVGGGRFMYLTRMNTNGGGYSFYSDGLDQWMTGIIEGSIGYTNLTWETASKTNIGIDLHLLKDRVNLSVDVFDEYRDRILIQRQTIPQMVGYVGSAIPYGNLGIVKNKGIETMLDINHTSASGIFYSLKGNFTFATNKIIENDEPKQKWSYQSAKGKRIDQPFGLVALGFFENEEEIASCPKQMFQSVVRPGDIKYLDYNNDGVIDQYDAIAIGHPRTPEIMYGFGATIGYKGWELSLAFTGAARTSFFLEGETIWPFINGEGSFNVLKEYYDNRYIYGADNSRAKYPAVGNGDSQNNYRPSTLWMMDGSYLKLKNAEIAYTLPQKVSNLLHIANIRLFMNGQNLLTIDKIKIIDPESNNGTGVYPSQRILNFGAKINF
jgi:TonB-linked SusC/RagA family outer membrane protein